jgi:hypothetical protein
MVPFISGSTRSLKAEMKLSCSFGIVSPRRLAGAAYE